jgi:NADPH:quinone reductase-like Zn-dependent oxidoreductase
MKAWKLTPGGGIEGLILLDLPEPVAGPGEVLIRVRSTSLNYRDLLMTRRNRHPIIPLSDGAGDVVAVGSGVAAFAPGDRVTSCFFKSWTDGEGTPEDTSESFGGNRLDGMLAELVALPESAVIHMPPHMNYDEAATLPCAALTAWNAMYVQARLTPGQSVLLLGTGGVSIAGLQLAAIGGVRSIITSSSDAKLERARALGADHTINYHEREDWERAALDATGGRGVDAVLEVGGAATYPKSMAATRFGGMVTLIGALAHEGGDPGTAPMLGRGLKAARIFVGSRRQFQDMNRALTLRKVHPVVDRAFSMDEAAEAFRCLESQAHFGKIVIRV